MSEGQYKARQKLLLVSMWTSSNGNASEGVSISKTVFLALIDVLKIDRSVLQPVANNVFGLVEFSETVIIQQSRKEHQQHYVLPRRLAHRASLELRLRNVGNEGDPDQQPTQAPPDAESQRQEPGVSSRIF